MLNIGPIGERYTYEDYEQWTDESRYEIIDGTIYAMSPAPSTKHQRILKNLGYEFESFLRGKKCEIFLAPFDVRLSDEDDIDTIVQPDLVLVCDKTGLDDKGYKGIPSLIVEILSKKTKNRDLKIKYQKYLEVGVKEYWIVDPDEERIIINVFRDGVYESHIYSGVDAIHTDILPHFEFCAEDIFGG